MAYLNFLREFLLFKSMSQSCVLGILLLNFKVLGISKRCPKSIGPYSKVQIREYDSPHRFHLKIRSSGFFS